MIGRKAHIPIQQRLTHSGDQSESERVLGQRRRREIDRDARMRVNLLREIFRGIDAGEYSCRNPSWQTATTPQRWREGVQGCVPYAAPPFGTNRLRTPRPVEPWAGVRDALAFGPKSPQVAYPPGIAEGIPELVSQGEDCLTLNIWTPELGAAGLPVMVWIPGPVRPRWGRVRDHRLPGGRRRLHLPA